MRHAIPNASFVRASLTTCDVFVLATSYSYLDSTPTSNTRVSPEQLIESIRPWFLDAETMWWRRFQMGCRA